MAKERFYYSSESDHGSETSYGFCNDTTVMVWSNKKARDKYVEESRNISCKAITRDQVTKQATNLCLTTNITNAPRPFSGEFWAVVEQDFYQERYEEKFPGFVGVINIADNYNYNYIRRFY